MAHDRQSTDLVADLRGMTGFDHVGRTAHRAAEEIERLRADVSELRARLLNLTSENRYLRREAARG